MCRYSKVQPIRPPWTCDVNIFVVVLLQSRWLLLLMRVVKEKRTRIEAALHQTLTTLFKRFLRNRYYLEPLYGCAATCALTHTRRASVCVRSNRFTFVCRRLANNKRIEKDKWFKSNHPQQLDVCKIVSMWFSLTPDYISLKFYSRCAALRCCCLYTVPALQNTNPLPSEGLNASQTTHIRIPFS